VLGAWKAFPILTIVAASAVVLTAGYMLWALQRMYLGQPNPKYASTGWEINGRELLTLVPLAAIVLVLGVYPKLVLQLQDPALRRLNAHVATAAAQATDQRVAAREP